MKNKDNKTPHDFNKLEKILMVGGLIISLGGLGTIISSENYKEIGLYIGMGGLYLSTLTMIVNLSKLVYKIYKSR